MEGKYIYKMLAIPGFALKGHFGIKVNLIYGECPSLIIWRKLLSSTPAKIRDILGIVPLFILYASPVSLCYKYVTAKVIVFYFSIILFP